MELGLSEQRFEAAELGGRLSPYDVPALETKCAEMGFRFIHVPETTSTMDIARLQGMVQSVVIADHQTAGRGRFDREWLDVSGKDLLVTCTLLHKTKVLPPRDSTALSQLCVLAAWNALQELYDNPDIQVRWPNDLTAYGQKLGGILLMEAAKDITHTAISYGIGINVHNLGSNDDFRETDYGAISLDEIQMSEITRGEIAVAILNELELMTADLAQMDNPATRAIYQDMMDLASSLQGRYVCITNVGEKQNATLEGKVMKTHFGGGLELETPDGTVITKEFNPKSKLEVLA